ncbi:hypothetical protein EVAR_6374_1 [Eumeta japonica]|uniref:Uncharacterized protein n=1 Tax=Eumeta variegata TaxID=151549 RepID=A0A4C1TDI3_EUMVA|nr:hypothetical protein EVAR_6374_1 [Eumeta japonica]
MVGYIVFDLMAKNCASQQKDPQTHRRRDRDIAAIAAIPENVIVIQGRIQPSSVGCHTVKCSGALIRPWLPNGRPAGRPRSHAARRRPHGLPALIVCYCRFLSARHAALPRASAAAEDVLKFKKNIY